MAHKPGPLVARKCQHCKKEVRIFRGRKLCYYCHKKPEIREKYPKERAGGVYCPSYREPTEEELNAMIEDGMRNLPDWWENSYAHDEIV